MQRLERDGDGSGETTQALAAALEVEMGAFCRLSEIPQLDVCSKAGKKRYSKA